MSAQRATYWKRSDVPQTRASGGRLIRLQPAKRPGQRPGMHAIGCGDLRDSDRVPTEPPSGLFQLARAHLRRTAQTLATPPRSFETLLRALAQQMPFELRQTADERVEQLAMRRARVDLQAFDPDRHAALCQLVELGQGVLGRAECPVEIEDHERIAGIQSADHVFIDRAMTRGSREPLDAEFVADGREGIDLAVDALLFGTDA